MVVKNHFTNAWGSRLAVAARREGIQWDPLDFPDNHAIVDLVGGKTPLGILPMLDEAQFVDIFAVENMRKTWPSHSDANFLDAKGHCELSGVHHHWWKLRGLVFQDAARAREQPPLRRGETQTEQLCGTPFRRTPSEVLMSFV